MEENLINDVKMLIERYEKIYQDNPNNTHIKVYLDALKVKLEELNNDTTAI